MSPSRTASWKERRGGEADLVKHPVEESGHHGEDGGLQGGQVVHQQPDVPLEVPDAAPVHQQQALGTGRTVQGRGGGRRATEAGAGGGLGQTEDGLKGTRGTSLKIELSFRDFLSGSISLFIVFFLVNLGM